MLLAPHFDQFRCVVVHDWQEVVECITESKTAGAEPTSPIRHFLASQDARQGHGLYE
jgi:hypothetical protein